MEIGTQIKHFRKQQKITLQELAARTGLSVAYLSNLERNTTSPTLVSLQNICTALDINITSLLQNHSSPSPVVRCDERREIFNLDSRVKYTLMVNGQRFMRGVCMTISADNFNEEVSWGHNTDEFGVVITGTLQIEMDGAGYVLEEGDSIYIPRDTSHKFKKLSAGECASYWVLNGSSAHPENSEA